MRICKECRLPGECAGCRIMREIEWEDLNRSAYEKRALLLFFLLTLVIVAGIAGLTLI